MVMSGDEANQTETELSRGCSFPTSFHRIGAEKGAFHRLEGLTPPLIGRKVAVGIVSLNLRFYKDFFHISRWTGRRMVCVFILLPDD